MNNSTANVLIVGILAVAAVMGMMMYYLDTLNQRPEGKALRIAMTIAGKHDITNFKTSAQQRPGGRILVISYETDKVLPTRDLMLEEMRQVAADTWKEMTPEERVRLDKAEVRRQFNRSTGCFQNSSREVLEWDPPPEEIPRVPITPPRRK